jgi:hypothetical protein
MCKFIKANNEQCKNSPNKEYCYIHTKKIIINDINLKQEIKNLNKTIVKKNEIIKSKSEIVIILSKKINSMKEDFDRYQIIKEYHIIKTTMLNLLPKSCPYSLINNIDNKDILEEIFKLPYNEILPYYSNLRYNRTKFSHCS